ncbi:MAG: hypothetical protein V3W41_10455 [Planctomycetota bacterium]
MKPPTKGYLSLEGLVEGPCPRDDSLHRALRVALSEAAWPKGVSFDLKLDDSDFSLLPSEAAVWVGEEDSNAPEERIQHALDGFMSVLPTSFRGSAFSTLRSRRTSSNSLVEAVYGLDASGKVVVQAKRKEIAEQPAERFTQPAWRIAATIGVLLVVAAGVWWGANQILGTVGIGHPQDLLVESKSLAPFVEVRWEGSGQIPSLVFTRLEACPTRLKQYETMRAAAAEADDATRWWKLGATFEGRFQVQFFDAEDRLLRLDQIRIPPAWEASSFVFRLVDPPQGISKVVIRP